MAADFVIVQGDTEPLFEEALTYSNGEVVNLEGATATFIMRALTAERPLALTGTVTIAPGKTGKLSFTPAAADTANPGNYLANWKVVFAGGEVQTFPTTGYLWVQVQPNLSIPSVVQLVGLPEVKEHLGIQENDHTHDTLLIRFIKAVQPLIENLTGPLFIKVHDEWHEGGHSTISLRHRPSYGYGTTPYLTLMSCSEYRGPIEYALSVVPTPTQGSVYSTMVHAELGMIVRRTSGGGTYPFWRDPSHPAQSVHVVYAAGQEQVPENVNLAAIEAIAWWYRTTQQVGKGRQTQADLELAQPYVALPYHSTAMLEPFKRGPAFA